MNLGNIERSLRGVLGLILIFAPVAMIPDFGLNPIVAYGSLIAGVILIGTALFGFCPIYRIFGLSTRS